MKGSLHKGDFRQRRRIEMELDAEVRRLFWQFPDLVGFSIEDRDGVEEEFGLEAAEDELFVTDMGFCPAVGDEEYLHAYDGVTHAIADLVAEQPEAFDLLRGTTFARTVH